MAYEQKVSRVPRSAMWAEAPLLCSRNPPEGAKSSFWSPKVNANVSSKVCALAHFLMLC